MAFLPLDDETAERTLGWIRTDERDLLPATRHLIAEVKRIVERRATGLDDVMPT